MYIQVWISISNGKICLVAKFSMVGLFCLLYQMLKCLHKIHQFMPGCGIPKTLYRCFPWAENGVEEQPCLFFATPWVKFQPLNVLC